MLISTNLRRREKAASPSWKRVHAARLLMLAALAIALPAVGADDPEVVVARQTPESLATPATFIPEDGVIVIEISEYAGYAGLLVANGGCEPNPDSLFGKRGLQVRVTVSEDENWSPLNAGQIAAAPSTVDVLAVYGADLRVKVPVLLGFSRGADGLIVTSDINNVNSLKGKRLAACQYTEADFFIRYLAQEASLPVKVLDSPDHPVDPDALNLVYAVDGLAAGDLFARDLKEKRGRLAGCVTWEPKISEVLESSDGAARLLATNRNLLIIADILMVNAGFAEDNPGMISSLTAGILEGNAIVRANPTAAAPVMEEIFGWSAEDTVEELTKVHLANWPENVAFFDGRIANAGSFGFIYETALDVYGGRIAERAAEAASFPLPDALTVANANGTFANEVSAIVPIQMIIEDEPEPLLSKDLFFHFVRNSAVLTPDREAENERQFENIQQWLRTRPGSEVRLRGHADGARLEEIEREQGTDKAQEARRALRGLSRERCIALREALAEKYGVDRERVRIEAVGAAEPTGYGPDADRRVETILLTHE